ncbi:MAG: 2-phospho-L-lactate transferase CofD family protein, partial [Acidimicrobiales bacterium]|nr:2-phospho-L-lactate transferase CofD family protein [Acidimicrobiales bacterium]
GLRLSPIDATAPPETVSAIEDADQIVLGPGSFFTSVLAATLSADVQGALARRSGPLVLVANLAQDREGPVELADHLRLLDEHGVRPDVLLMDDRSDRTPPIGPEVVRAPLAGRDGRVHDPVQLGSALASCLGRRGCSE